MTPAATARMDSDAPNPALRRWLLILAVSLGVLRIWAWRDLQGGDLTSYLDIADYYSRADWPHAINSFWSPLYSWLLALLLAIFRPAAEWEYSLVAGLNIAIYLASLGCFLIFWRTLDHLRRRFPDACLLMLSANSWLILGYDLFLWMSLLLIRPGIEAPDLLLTCFVLLAAALLIRIRLGESPLRNQILLGILLGFGFLAKSALLPIALVFAFVASSVPALRSRLKSAAIVVAAFFAVAAPWILTISAKQGRFTLSDTPALNYAWHVNHASMFHWQGEDPAQGVATHTSRRIFDNPPAFDFYQPRAGTYPAFFDPPYWNQGLRPHFDPAQQWQSITFNGWLYVLLLLSRADLLLGALVLAVLARNTGFATRFRQYSFLVLPALVACGLYKLVHVERRYVAPYLVLIAATYFAALRVSDSPLSRKLPAVVICALAAFTGFSLVLRLPEDVRNLRHRPERVQWQLAQQLTKRGLQPGDGIAIVGVALWNSSAARLSRTHIVAEVPVHNLNDFWSADAPTRQRLFDAFAAAGAKAAILECAGRCALPEECTQLENTSAFAAPERRVLAVCSLKP